MLRASFLLAGLAAACAGPVEPLKVAGQSTRRVAKAVARGEPVDGRDRRGVTPLVQAAIEGRIDLVRFLLRRGAAIDEKDSFGEQAIHWAARRCEIEVLDWLLRAGADPTAPTAGSGDRPLHLAIETRCVVGADRLLASGARLSDGNVLGQSALHAAAQGDPRYGAVMVEWALAHGADASQPDLRGFDAVHTAARSNHVTALDTFAAHGVDVDRATPSGIRPVDTAAWTLAGASLRWFAAHGYYSQRYPVDDPLRNAVTRNDPFALSWMLSQDPRVSPQEAETLRAAARTAGAKSAASALDVLLAKPAGLDAGAPGESR